MLERNIFSFLEEAGPIFFVTPAVGRAIGLEKEIPDFHIICSKKPDNLEILGQSGVKVFHVGEGIKNSGKLLSDIKTLEYIKKNSRGGIANIITFKPSPMIEKLCKKNDFRYLGNTAALNREFEDKVKFAEITKKLGIANANSRVVNIGGGISSDISDFSDGKKCVVQFAHGYSGNSTFLVKNQNDLNEILKSNGGRKIKISDFKEGDTYTFNACVGSFGTLVSQPIFQITGFTAFNRNSLGTCGNDYAYGKSLDDEIKNKAEDSIKKVAAMLFSLGYRGIAGFDFVVSDREAHLIEINPRLVGSIPVFTKLELAAGEIPFLLLHILSFLDFDFKGIDFGVKLKEFDFSQLILRNTENKSIKIEKTLLSGVYKLQKGIPILQRESYFANNMEEGEFFLECASKGQMIDPDMEYANIQFNCGIIENKENIKNSALEIIKAVLAEIILH
ncbi:MAG: ATP-grasp domain-containing protein [Candidatus Pacebacteria bacterium]|nr:ATP-grasp domain-containing protein [Candidatus Paceibacterota bacterium]